MSAAPPRNHERAASPARARQTLTSTPLALDSVPAGCGVKLVVTATDPGRFPDPKALGFVGILTLGSHHQLHHLMMAKREFTHSH